MRVTGLVFPKYNESRIVTDDDKFVVSWFDFGKFPMDVQEALNALRHRIDVFLQTENIIPKQWPSGLGLKPEEYPVDFRLGVISLVDIEWFGTRDVISTVEVIAKAKHFEDTSARIQLPNDIVEPKEFFGKLKELL